MRQGAEDVEDGNQEKRANEKCKEEDTRRTTQNARRPPEKRVTLLHSRGNVAYTGAGPLHQKNRVQQESPSSVKRRAAAQEMDPGFDPKVT
ncbi:hypothetical protein NDU88_001056 [Pleurodeles waltl]|uniref:Uncharacterized protein n=1 Tax=Pleurodeles waltl TaxID=8319 RepID=A0AAV7WJR3_PLEWA|nr:hypothetical protein NDU88_001056 [Pleurodeles waltl]